MISITLDMEWAPSPVIDDVLSLLDSFEIGCTFFATHDDGRNFDHHERSIHPNFLNDSSTEEEVLDELLNLYPEVIGLRSHSLYVHSKLRSIYAKRGIRYESNYMMYRVENIEPFLMLPDIVQFPIYFMDDEWFRRRSNEDEQCHSPKKLLEPSGLKVFDFHPPHIAFNTPTTEYYNKHKNEYWSDTIDIERVRYDGYGVRDLFKSLLGEIERADHETALLSTLEQEYRETEERSA